MQVRCFNSRPHEEVDYDPASEKTREIGVSTHDLTKRSTSAYLVSQAQLEFQLTTSRRGRHSIVRAVIWLFICFNSRPHEEVDGKGITLYYDTEVSTHDLTKRSTFIPSLIPDRNLLFQLTTSRRGRPTLAFEHNMTEKGFNSRPHEEVDLYLQW